jgi:hypothetical protein
MVAMAVAMHIGVATNAPGPVADAEVVAPSNTSHDSFSGVNSNLKRWQLFSEVLPPPLIGCRLPIQG